MAYSDYGGYAYRDGLRVEDRSDYTIRTDGSGFGTPGVYPGFINREAIELPHHHVVLGDGPILVGLHKQTGLLFYRNGQKLNVVDFLTNPDPEARWRSDDRLYLNTDWFQDRGEVARFLVDDHKIQAFWSRDFVQFVRLVQPDGTVWTGFSGYGVGAGLEDVDYGDVSTAECENDLRYMSWGPDQ